MRVEIQLSRQVRDVLMAYVMAQQGHRYDERQQPAPIIFNCCPQLVARGTIERVLEVAGDVLQDVRMALRRRDRGERLDERRGVVVTQVAALTLLRGGDEPPEPRIGWH